MWTRPWKSIVRHKSDLHFPRPATQDKNGGDSSWRNSNRRLSGYALLDSSITMLPWRNRRNFTGRYSYIERRSLYPRPGRLPRVKCNHYFRQRVAAWYSRRIMNLHFILVLICQSKPEVQEKGTSQIRWQVEASAGMLRMRCSLTAMEQLFHDRLHLR